ncbi:MAG: hypothetical protein NC405_04615 [Odoribacter sp.]|nr:hypothetical protein [Odoribacter sp.]
MKKILLTLVALLATCGFAQAQDVLYIVGSNSGWATPDASNASAYENWTLAKTSENVYEGTVTFNAGVQFRFYKALTGWDGNNSLGPSYIDDDVISVSSGATGSFAPGKKAKWSLENFNGGEVKLTVDLSTNTFKAEYEITIIPDNYVYAIHGQIFGDPDWSSTDMTANEDGTWSLTANIVSGKFGIKYYNQNGNVQLDWYAAQNGSPTAIVNVPMTATNNNCVNWESSLEGEYTFVFDPEAQTLTIKSDIDIPMVTPYDEESIVYFVAPAGVTGGVHTYIWNNDGPEIDWGYAPASEVAEGMSYNGRTVYCYRYKGDYNNVIFWWNGGQTNDLKVSENHAKLVVAKGNKNETSYDFKTPELYLKSNLEFSVHHPDSPVKMVIAGGQFKFDDEMFGGDWKESHTFTEFGNENSIEEVIYRIKNASGVEFTEPRTASILNAPKEVYLYVAYKDDADRAPVTFNLASTWNSEHNVSINSGAVENAYIEVIDNTLEPDDNGNYFYKPVKLDGVKVPAHMIFSTVTFMLPAANGIAAQAEDVLSGNNMMLDLTGDTPVLTDNFNFKSDVSSVEAIEATAAEATIEYYNLQGMRVDSALTPGLYIRRQGTTTTKVLVK